MLPTPEMTPAGRIFQVDRIAMAEGGLLIEFRAVPGQEYAVQDPHGDGWRTVPMTVRAAGNRVQWIDDGSPKTPSRPETVPLRLYRVIELSPPPGG